MPSRAGWTATALFWTAVVALGALFYGLFGTRAKMALVALPEPMAFEEVTYGWRDNGIWEICEVPVILASCPPTAAGDRTRLIRSFITATGATIPAEALGETSGSFGGRAMIDLSAMRPGRLPRTCVRFDPPEDVIGYMAEISAPTGGCTNGYAGRRPLLSPDIARRPRTVVEPD